MKIRIYFFCLFFTFSFYSFGQIPTGYYDAATGKIGSTLKTALYNIIKDHTVLSYSSLENQMKFSDAKPNNVVWDMYSDIPGGTPPYIYYFVAADQCGNYSAEGDCWNKEHSLPQSWFNSSSPMKSDLFHIYATDGKVNGQRSNYPYGEVGVATWTSLNGSKLGSCIFPGCSGTVFEPINEYKGDFARSFFYMVTRYENIVSSWSSSAPNVLNGTSFPALEAWALNLFQKWNFQDPISQKEIDRNNVIYGYQNNRNPFIDHPEFSDAIWGIYMNTESVLIKENYFSLSPNPTNKTVAIHFSENNAGNYKITVLNILGQEQIHSNFPEGNNTFVDISNLAAGTYFVKVSGSGFTEIQKLIVTD